ncbi:oxidoreductase [Janthinobacterium psychrotolerans]|uniref:Scyllo-inositol 2-dehydrogenase (NADP+) n=1 Tax=Janthinobacterium psychrotolerans TaxID=1747903 RepID=A0A1A7BZ79_9BURK|nr:oxidoreductase [Janthinobacterium psychrotolerans]OBV38966.1 scyllo-inositol 2-dehydrogenase (NADP+) [Janthinobacterium psychrotolerans]
MNKIKTGLVGYGFAGATFHAPVLTSVEALELTAVASSKPDLVHKDWPEATVYAEAAQLFADAAIELVVIAAPNEAHFGLARAALQAGKHVVVDKPFTITSAEAQTLITLAKERKLVLSVYHNRRWDGDFMTIKTLLAQGVLGRVTSFESHFDRFRPEIRQRWRESNAPGGGLLYDLGPHMLDQAVQLFGMPDKLHADIDLQRDGAQAVDYLHIVLYYQRLRVVLQAGCLVKAPTARFAVHGDAGSFMKFGLDPQEDALKAGGRPGQPGWGEDGVRGALYLGTQPDGQCEHLDLQAGRYQDFYQGMADAIRDGKPAPVAAEDALDTIRLIELALQSANEGRVLNVPAVA